MSVAASSPAWLTRRAAERKSRCSLVRGLSLPLGGALDEEAWPSPFGEEGMSVGVASVGGVLDSRRRELGVKSAGARKSLMCTCDTRTRWVERISAFGGGIEPNGDLLFLVYVYSTLQEVNLKYIYPRIRARRSISMT